MPGPIYCSCTRGSRTHKRNQRKAYTVSHPGVWDVWSLFLLSSLPGLLPSFPSFLPIPRICFPKPVCVLCSPVIMDLSSSDPITKLPVVCILFCFCSRWKKKGVGWGGNLLKRIKLTQLIILSHASAQVTGWNLDWLSWDCVLPFIQSAASLFQELKWIQSDCSANHFVPQRLSRKKVNSISIVFARSRIMM